MRGRVESSSPPFAGGRKARDEGTSTAVRPVHSREEGGLEVKVTVELWVRLKVIDLVAQTADITFTDKLDFADTLRGMAHYSYWSMEADGADVQSILGEIDRVVRLDSAFTNQNKHRYRLSAAHGPAVGDLPLDRDFPVKGAPSPGGNLFAFDCLVREKRPDRENGYAERLNARLRGVAVAAMKYGEVWRLIVSAPSRDAALVDIEKMLVSRSRREGLLLNPHYQQYEIINTTRLEAGASSAPVPAKERRP
jgi:hypothetical protein